MSDVAVVTVPFQARNHFQTCISTLCSIGEVMSTDLRAVLSRHWEMVRNGYAGLDMQHGDSTMDSIYFAIV